MAGGYVAPSGDVDWVAGELRRISDRLYELEAPTGTSMNSLVQQVQEAIAAIGTTVAAWLEANAYTSAEVDAKIASPGAIAPTTVSASGAVSAASVSATGDVTSAGQVDSAGAPLRSQPSYGYMVTTSYKGLWIDGVTFQVGYSPSAAAVKTDLAEMTEADIERLLALTPYWGRYLWDDPASPPKVFLLAADVQAAGFGPDVAPVVDGEPLEMIGADGLPVLGADGEPVIVPAGEAYTVNYSQLVVPLLGALRAEVERGLARDALITSLTARMDAAGI